MQKQYTDRLREAFEKRQRIASQIRELQIELRNKDTDVIQMLIESGDIGCLNINWSAVRRRAYL